MEIGNNRFRQRQSIFIARETSGLQWLEQTLQDGEPTDMSSGGRACTGADSHQVIELDETRFFLMEMLDSDRQTVRYVKISGGGGGSAEPIGNLKGQVHTMVSNNQDGWDFPVTVI